MRISRGLLSLAGALVALALLGGGAYALFYYRSPPPPAPALPVPNGYDDLLRAGGMVVHHQNSPEEMGVEELRAYVAENREALEAARQGLARECRVPIKYTEGYDAGRSMVIRTLWGVFEAEGLLAEKEGRIPAAVTAYLDWQRLGVKGFRGGLVIHRMIGDACRSFPLGRLLRLRAGFGAMECKLAIHGLEEALADEEPVEDVSEREAAWTRANHTWAERIIGTVFYSGGRGWVETRFRSTAARHRMLLADLGLRAHRLEKGTFPKALSDLVPEYLSSVPEDPFAGKPLVYRPSGNTYLLYSVGPDGRDDGGMLDDYFLESKLINAGLYPGL